MDTIIFNFLMIAIVMWIAFCFHYVKKVARGEWDPFLNPVNLILSIVDFYKSLRALWKSETVDQIVRQAALDGEDQKALGEKPLSLEEKPLSIETKKPVQGQNFIMYL